MKQRAVYGGGLALILVCSLVMAGCSPESKNWEDDIPDGSANIASNLVGRWKITSTSDDNPQNKVGTEFILKANGGFGANVASAGNIKVYGTLSTTNENGRTVNATHIMHGMAGAASNFNEKGESLTISNENLVMKGATNTDNISIAGKMQSIEAWINEFFGGIYTKQ